MPFLYGKADEKFVKTDSGTKTPKLKPLDTYKFNLSPQLEGNQKIRPCEVSIRLRTSPDKLVEICSPVLDGIPLPSAFYWNVQEVADWIRKLGFPQYQNTFKKNQVNGRSLIRLDASYLVKMNIKDFDHLKIITQAIRDLYGFDKSVFKRSISMPQRDLDNLYKFFRTRTGPKYDMVRRTDVGRMHHLIRPRSLYETHWQSLERWLKHTDTYEAEYVGGIIRLKNTMYNLRKEACPSIGQKRSYNECSGMPPCTCKWTEQRDLRKPWKLRCLRMRNKIHHKTQPNDHECKCFEMCTCLEAHKGFSLLKEYIPHKYGTTYDNRPSFDRFGRVRSSEI